MEIRLSLGSAMRLGLEEMRMDAQPTTLYAMLGDHCSGACTFCTQARDNVANRKFLSRVVWPVYDLDEVAARLANDKGIERICIQTLKDPHIMDTLPQVIQNLHAGNHKPISVCMNPVDRSALIDLKNAGAERVGTGLDCATPESFARIKPGFSWNQVQHFITDTMDVFGHGSVHLIVGLGDSDEDLIQAFQHYTDLHCSIGLFALTPVRGTKLKEPAPPVERYRALQVARYLINAKQARADEMTFVEGKLHSITSPSTAVTAALS
ncbi:MAG: radical SAM protein, partial [Anaerolineales bacterium]